MQESKFSDKITNIQQKQLAILCERNTIYKEGYSRHSKIMESLFANADPESFKKFVMSDDFFFINMIIAKLVRFCDNYEQGGHEDSIIDLCNYATLLISTKLK